MIKMMRVRRKAIATRMEMVIPAPKEMMTAARATIRMGMSTRAMARTKTRRDLVLQVVMKA